MPQDRPQSSVLFPVRSIVYVYERVLILHRECQVEDWKHGKPYAHKLICGQPLDEKMFESILAARSKKVEDEASKTRTVPPPDSTFQRSPALVYQIALVTERPDVDYAVRFPPIPIKWTVIIYHIVTAHVFVPGLYPRYLLSRSTRYVCILVDLWDIILIVLQRKLTFVPGELKVSCVQYTLQITQNLARHSLPHWGSTRRAGAVSHDEGDAKGQIC